MRSNHDRDNDPTSMTHIPLFEDLKVPELPSIEGNTLDDDNTLTLNDSDIDS